MNKIIQTKQKQIDILCKKYHVKALEVFGSAARNTFDATQSDIDFLVEFDQIGIENYADNYFGLLADFKKLFKHPIDLVVSSSIRNPYFLESIEKERATLYAA